MTWDCLNKVVDKNVSELRLAKWIVIQLGSNDLGIKKTYELYSDTKRGLMKLKVMCPNARIVTICMVRNTYKKVLAQCSGR